MPLNFTDKSLWSTANPALNNINAVTLGQVNALLQAAGVQVGYGQQGDLGKRIVISESEAAGLSLLTIGTLFGGIYQLVQVDTGATGANIFPGAAAYLLDTATGGAANSGAAGYVVTDSAHALSTQLGAGVFLNAITPGNFGFIQVHGKATVKYTAAVTSTAIGDIVVFGGATAGTFNALLAATATTNLQLGTWLGNSIQAPANAALGTVFMSILRGRY